MKELPPQYSPKEVEEKIYRMWETSGFFNPDKLPGKRAKSYTITVPPPNVTGSLHMGHALNAVIQDILIRKKRMEGLKTLWLPGTDHAGIATQNVVEKDLKKQGIRREDLGREKFLEKVWEWKEKYGNTILGQFKTLGSSMDWSRTRFTMDPDYQRAVEEAFLHYYKKGWVYQAERVINWCTRCRTSLSDLELEYKEEKATWYSIRYGPLTIGTVRPETKVGDTAIAVNPKDPRYKKYIGKELEIETVLGPRKMKVVADPNVDMKFGTGAMKVTPGHDIHDFELAEKHGLEVKKVIGPDGKMTELAEKYAGMPVAEARKQIVEDLHRKGLIVEEKPYTHNVAVCYRCATIIEPMPSVQWFLKMSELAKTAIASVKSGKVKFHPKRWEKVYFDWLKNIKDWCISRQIWWGHQIPLWKCMQCDEVIEKPKIKSRWYIVRHGQTDWNVAGKWQGQENIPLNDTGRTQAKEAAERLKDLHIDLIISSDLLRCRETAEIIAKELGTELIFDKNLRERNGGEAQGLTVEERIQKFGKEAYDSWTKTEHGRPPGGENWREVEDRLLAALAHHKSNHQHKNIAIITHGGPIRTLMRKWKNMPWEDRASYTIKNTDIIPLTLSQTACSGCRSDLIEPITDVLDTWFSSALWPFATLGWPIACAQNQNLKSKTQNVCKPLRGSDLDVYYPTQVLSTARDIINLWVARMVFSGLEFTKKPPFKDVIIHATILTKDGRRMSKSLGTGIDPMDLISRYSADATRFGLIWQAMGNQDIHWAEEHVLAGRKFCNKIWNASRFVLATLDLKPQTLNPRPRTAADKKILAQLKKTQKAVNEKVEKYEFGPALHTLYYFFWHQFCDIYLEASKKQLADPKLKASTQHILLHTLATSLKLLHPFMPFVTEEIWGHLPTKNKQMLLVESWPK